MKFEGQVFRVLNVIWQKEPLSAEGARLMGGRFNPIGMPVLYTSLSLDTAYREYSQQMGNRVQPGTLVSYELEVENLLDLSGPEKAEVAGFDWDDVSDPEWRLNAKLYGTSPSQRVGQTALKRGYNGLFVQSFAKGAVSGGINIVLFNWSDSLPSKIIPIDDQNRLA